MAQMGNRESNQRYAPNVFVPLRGVRSDIIGFSLLGLCSRQPHGDEYAGDMRFFFRQLTATARISGLS